MQNIQTQQGHRRKGRTASGSGANNTNDTSSIPDESQNINLPTGQNVNASDFDIPTCLGESMSRLSLMPDHPGNVGQGAPVISSANTSDPMNQYMFRQQVSLVHDVLHLYYYHYMPLQASSQAFLIKT